MKKVLRMLTLGLSISMIVWSQPCSISTYAEKSKTPPIPAAIRQASATAHLQNNLLDLYFQEQYSDLWRYQYELGSWGESCYHEHFAVYTAGTGTMESEDFIVDAPFVDPGGVPGTITAVLHSGDIQVTRKITLPPGDARYFQIIYTVENIGSTTLQDMRFFETIDFDVPWTGDHTDDYARYDLDTDYIWIYDPDYFQNGMASNIRSTRHGIDYWYTEIYDDWDDGGLNNQNSYGPGDPAIGKQFNFGNLALGESRSLILTIWEGEPGVVEEANITGIAYFSGNKAVHHTDNYSETVFRRAQAIAVQVGIEGLYDEAIHSFCLSIKRPDGQTETVYRWTPELSEDKWSFREGALLGQIKTLIVSIPRDAQVGKYLLTIELYKYDGNTTVSLDSETGPEFYIIFNPWNVDGDTIYDDDVYNPNFNNQELSHYIEGKYDSKLDIGLNYYPDGTLIHEWKIGSTNSNVFHLAINEISAEESASTAMEMLTDKAAQVIAGDWTPPYDAGYGHIGWKDVPKMIKRYVETNGAERPIGQCLDFAGLTNAFARTVGIPSRMLTCHLSTHPYYRYHAGDEVWLNSIISNEWSVADATPGELEGVGTRCAPEVQDYNIQYSDGVYTYNARTDENPKNILGEYQQCYSSSGSIRASSTDINLSVTTDQTQYYYGQEVSIVVTAQNTSNQQITGELNVSIRAGLFLGQRFDYEIINYSSRTITIPANSSLTETYSLTDTTYQNSGVYRVLASLDGVQDFTDFTILGGLELTLSAPDSADINEDIEFSLDVRNALPYSINNVEVYVYFPEDVSGVSTEEHFSLPSLSPGEVHSRTWTVNFSKSGFKVVQAITSSDDGGYTRAGRNIWIRTEAQVYPHIVPVYNVQESTGFALTGKVTNNGDKTATGVQATLSIPPEFSTSDPLNVNIGDLPANSETTISWQLTPSQAGGYTIELEAQYLEGAAVSDSVIVDVVSYEHDVSISANPTVVRGTIPQNVILTIENLGSTQDSVIIESFTSNSDISYTIYDNDIPIISGPVTVPPNSSYDLTMVVTPPPQGASSGTMGVSSQATQNIIGSITVTAVSELDPTAADSATVDVVENKQPVANAGGDQSVDVGSTVHLDGSASYDSDGDPLTYSWTFLSVPPGSSVIDDSLSDPIAVDPSFTPDVVGNYALQLTVSDGLGGSGSDDIVITALGDTPAVFRVDSIGNVYADKPYYGAGFHTGSADVAEWVPVSEPVEPGDVLELDPDNPGQYRKARKQCSDLVAGVVSTKPGFVLGGDPTTPGSVLPTPDRTLLALIGIVPVKVTGEGGPIQPGDLLVTSSTSGHAMRWDLSDGSPCDLVGKALEPLAEESGIILVLLTAH